MQLINDFIEFYQSLEKKDISGLRTVYADDIEFVDPITRHDGIDQLERYFHKLLRSTLSCRFDIHDVTIKENDAFVNWTMTYQSSSLQSGKHISVDGCSKLQFENDRIIYHRDYFDVGQMVYEHIPFVGWLVNKVKRRLSQ